MEYEAFQPFSRLVEISVVGLHLEVPENNVLLRCFQYLEPKLPFGPWCWNGDCGSDRITYRLRGEQVSRVGLACQLPVSEGIEILEITPDLRRALARVLAEAASRAGKLSAAR